MATIRYDQVPLTIHYNDRSETILAYNCALSEAADLRPVKGIGFKGTAEPEQLVYLFLIRPC